MASKPAQTKVAKPKKQDLEKKGKTKSNSKKTSQGKSRNSRKIDKSAVRERKGR